MSSNAQTRIVQKQSCVTISVDNNIARIIKTEEVARFAYDFVSCARYFSNQAQSATDANSWQLKSSVLSSIIMAYASIEATLHEFMHLRVLSKDSNISPDKKEVFYWMQKEELAPEGKSDALRRFNSILRILEKEPMSLGEEPYQSANILRLLRNYFIHPVPTIVVTFDSNDPDVCMKNDYTKKLKSILKLPADATFPKSIITAECAAWASKSAESFLKEFEDRAGISVGFVLRP
jgi:hypothetical protein